LLEIETGSQSLLFLQKILSASQNLNWITGILQMNVKFVHLVECAFDIFLTGSSIPNCNEKPNAMFFNIKMCAKSFQATALKATSYGITFLKHISIFISFYPHTPTIFF